jgi:hypothetical protein
MIGRIDPRLRVGANGTAIPITIGGTREKPVFRVDADALKGGWKEVIGIAR